VFDYKAAMDDPPDTKKLTALKPAINVILEAILHACLNLLGFQARLHRKHI
jgi:hypothetical protein